MKIAIVGATGMVGRTMLKVLDERNLNYDELTLVASDASEGKEIVFQEKTFQTTTIDKALEQDLDAVLFSAGGSVSQEYAPKFAKKGAYVIDNSSAWRMEDSCPLVVPQINAGQINESTKIIANPNLSLIHISEPTRPY